MTMGEKKNNLLSLYRTLHTVRRVGIGSGGGGHVDETDEADRGERRNDGYGVYGANVAK